MPRFRNPIFAGFVTACVLAAIGHAYAQDGPQERVAAALRKLAAADSYAFTAEEKPGPGTGGAVEAKYQKGRPLYCKAENIECYKSGDAVVYREGEMWLRSKTGVTSDPLRVLGAVAKVRRARLPHDELAGLEKAVRDQKPLAAPKGGVSGYSGTLSPEAVGKLVRSEHRGVARSGTVSLWLDRDGRLTSYEIAIRVQGRLGNAEIDGTTRRTVTLRDYGTTRVDVPDAARKALE